MTRRSMEHRPFGRLSSVVLLAVSTGLVLAACGNGGSTTDGSTTGGASSNLSGTLNGSGSTFQLTYQQQAMSQYKSSQPSVAVNYGGGGSGKGRTDLASGVVNYAGSDSPIPADEASSFKGKVLYFPVVIAPITIAYNLPGVSKLQLTPTVIAGIFEAKITTWNSSAISGINPGVTLPATPITIARRSDSSGTTANFTDFLAKSAGSDWTLGSGSTIKWPATSQGGNGNGGVASIVKSTTGAIGYVDYPDAKASGLEFAYVQNKEGRYVYPSPSSASAAASKAVIANDLTFSAIWTAGASSYPITYQSWVLVYQKQSSSTATLLRSWVGYLLGPGQKLLPSLNYAPLPTSLQQKAQAQLSEIGSSS